MTAEHLLDERGAHDVVHVLPLREPLPDPSVNQPPPARGVQRALLDEESDAVAPRKRWAWLLAHGFAADVERCPRCSRSRCWAAVVRTHAQSTRLLARHGLGPRAPPAERVFLRVPEQRMLGVREGERPPASTSLDVKVGPLRRVTPRSSAESPPARLTTTLQGFARTSRPRTLPRVP